MDEQPQTADRISVAGKIRRHSGPVELLVVEDLRGVPMAYTQSDSLARLYFAAPGMMHLMERIAKLCGLVVGSDMEQEVQQEAQDIMIEINMVFQAAVNIEIDREADGCG